MNYFISFSPRSLSEFQSALNYLYEEWGESAEEKFKLKTIDLLVIICDAPQLFPCISKKKKVHRCVISNRVSLYYRISDNEIELLSFFQTRRHPGKLKL